jgi:hypothetical protein
MKVRFAVGFDEAQLRSIRASIGRGGKATRKECQVFIDRAVRLALDKAPEAKPVRVKRAKPEPEVTREESTTEEHDRLRATRERIAKHYGTRERSWRMPRNCPSCGSVMEKQDGSIAEDVVTGYGKRERRIRPAVYWACTGCEHCEEVSRG